MTKNMSSKEHYKKLYDPLAAGSIDGTDTVPHDRAIYRAMNSIYRPPKKHTSNYVIFVGRLPLSTTEMELEKKFSRAGRIKSCRIVRDIVTGKSRGYGFIEYSSEESAVKAYYDFSNIQFDGKSVIVDWEVSSSFSGWIPRRLGGGWGGKKESGQLRFGCRNRPWYKPIVVPQHLQEKSGKGLYRQENNKGDKQNYT